MFRKKRKEEGAKYGDITLEPLILQNSRLKFSPEQLQNLNFVFNKKLQYRHDYLDKTLSQAKSVAERLIQRLLCAAGSADSRFASKFLIVDNSTSSHNNKRAKSVSGYFPKGLSYLVRLDELSTPCLYDLDSTPRLEIIENDSDCPPAYCRIRLPTAAVSLWGEFLNPSYFLRRDKVQTRLVELLANAAGSDTPNSSLHVDESILCGVPGKLVDAATLYHLLKVPSFQHIYYGPGGSMPRFPDPRDFRIAIVDEPEGIRLKIEFLSPAFANTCLNIRLLVAVGVDAWPSSSKFPHRISMAHCDCLLYHKAATTGMYLVGYGVQSSAWQIRVPAAENTILNHYSESSTIRTILDILYDSIEEIEISRNLKKHQISYKILNKYIMLTVLLEELEKVPQIL
ncbi:hypothetical protein HHI36_015662 [Cryptolaemus montrouzieri]|uniref:Uncharacterized protein n=1 Tax=Cryptolaemus montrouzieri TaxID=559131 RepID=A0ABD2N6Q7_9CUCU